MEKLTNVQAIRRFFGSPGLRDDLTYSPPSMDELKALSASEREELGRLCADVLGVEIIKPV